MTERNEKENEKKLQQDCKNNHNGRNKKIVHSKIKTF